MKGVFYCGQKKQISTELKIKTIGDYLSAPKGISKLREDLTVKSSVIYGFGSKHNNDGIHSLPHSSSNHIYSDEGKLMALSDYLNTS